MTNSSDPSLQEYIEAVRPLLREFIEAVRTLREIENHYYHDRNEYNLSDMRNAQKQVDMLLKKYPKEGWGDKE